MASEVGGRAETPVREQCLGAGPMQVEPLGRQQVVGHGLGEQRMPELITVLPARLQHVALDGGAECTAQRARVDAGDLLKKVVTHPATDDRRDPHHGLGVVVEVLDPGEKQPGKVAGVGATSLRCGGQLLSEEGVPLRPARDLLDHARLQVGADPTHDAAQVGVRQGAELDASEGGQPRPQRESAHKGMTAVDVVAAPGDEQAHAVGTAAREQQSEQLAGRLVGPVNVLDDDEHRPAATEGGERAVHRLDEIGAPDVPAHPARQARHEGDQARVCRDQLVDEVAVPGVQARQHLDEGEVGKGRAGLADAMPDEDQPLGGVLDEPADHGGLADARVTTEQDGTAAALVPAERSTDATQLLMSTHEWGG